MHYKARANAYKLLGRGVVGSCFGVRYCSYLGSETPPQIRLPRSKVRTGRAADHSPPSRAAVMER